MAKRKRLKPANPHTPNAASEAPAPAAASSGPLTATGPAIQPMTAAAGELGKRAPIADVASEASAVAALQEVSQVMEQARDQGRMVIRLDLAEIETDYLVRDRLLAEEDEMTALVDSIRERGQQSPVEVVALPSGRYGLISGWRRCEAIRRLGADGPGKVDALLRRPETASDAYQSMVEENEIRVGLSYFERARIAAKSVDQGVFETHKDALLTLFRAASRAKRSKIRSFLIVVDQLETSLSYPQAIGERLGLTLSKALEADSALSVQIQAALRASPPASAEEEQATLDRCLKARAKDANQGAGSDVSRAKQTETPDVKRPRPEVQRCGPVNLRHHPEDGRIEIWGEGLTPDLQDRLKQWLRLQV